MNREDQSQELASGSSESPRPAQASRDNSRLSYQAKGLLALLREHGPYGLGGSDGCRCCHFSNYNISVDMSCHKSNGGVDKWHRWGALRITSGSFDVGMDDYKAIAEELLSQLREPSWEEEYEDGVLACSVLWMETRSRAAMCLLRQAARGSAGLLVRKLLAARVTLGRQGRG